MPGSNSYFTTEVIVFGSLLMVILTAFLVSFLSYHFKRRQKHLQEKHQLQAQFLQTQIEIQEQTFQTISQEIHDNIGQILTLAKLNLNTVEPNLPEITTSKILRSKELVSKAISDLRDLSKSLNTELIKDVGLHEAIQQEILLVGKTGQYELNFTLDGEPLRFDNQKELILFRIFQELTQNIIKHSKAKTVDVRLQYEPQAFTLKVSDDGEGFDCDRLSTEQHFGLGIRNMQNRTSLIGATFELQSTPGKGTVTTIQLPFTPKDVPA